MSSDRDRAERAALRRRTWTGGVARGFEAMDDVDLDFWLRATPGERLRAVTELISETLWIGGERGPVPRFDRSAFGVRPRKG